MMYPSTNWNSGLDSNNPLVSRPSSYRSSHLVSDPPPYVKEEAARRAGDGFLEGGERDGEGEYTDILYSVLIGVL